MKQIKQLLKGKAIFGLVAILALAIGGTGGFFIGQNHQQSVMKAQREKMMQNFKNGNGFPGGAPGGPQANQNSDSNSSTSQSGTTTSSSSDSTTTGV